MKPIMEPWTTRYTVDGQFCLERWYFSRMVDSQLDGYPRYTTSIRWWSGHKLKDGSLPWGGNASHWLQHVQSHGHTPAITADAPDFPLDITATEYIERILA